MAFTHGTLTTRRRRRSCFLRTCRGTSFMPNTSPVVPILNERNHHKSETMVAPMRQQRLLEPVPSRVDVSIRFDSEWRASTSRNQIMLRSDQPSCFAVSSFSPTDSEPRLISLWGRMSS